MHRTASINEYSTRYTEAIDARQETPPDEWRLQATSNKQGSSGFLTEWPAGWSTESNNDGDSDVGMMPTCNLLYQSPDGGFKIHEHGCGSEGMTPGQYLTQEEESFHTHAEYVYQRRLDLGVAREQARKDLPLSTYTEAYWKIDLHNLLHFLGLRMDSHAQLEIRTYATIIGEQIVAQLFPETWAAFKDYRLNAMGLSSLDCHVLKQVMIGGQPIPMQVPAVDDAYYWPDEWLGKARCSERDECVAKLQKLCVMRPEPLFAVT